MDRQIQNILHAKAHFPLKAIKYDEGWSTKKKSYRNKTHCGGKKRERERNQQQNVLQKKTQHSPSEFQSRTL